MVLSCRIGALRGKMLQYPLGRREGRTQRRCGYDADEKNLCTYRRSNVGHPASSHTIYSLPYTGSSYDKFTKTNWKLQLQIQDLTYNLWSDIGLQAMFRNQWHTYAYPVCIPAQAAVLSSYTNMSLTRLPSVNLLTLILYENGDRDNI